MKLYGPMDQILYYPATPGWDYPSGLGTPNLADFYQVISRDIM
jgi:hypothetical protein